MVKLFLKYTFHVRIMKTFFTPDILFSFSVFRLLTIMYYTVYNAFRGGLMKNYKGSRILTLRLPAREEEKLMKVVQETGMSISDLIREGIMKALEEYREIWEKEEP